MFFFFNEDFCIVKKQFIIVDFQTQFLGKKRKVKSKVVEANRSGDSHSFQWKSFF